LENNILINKSNIWGISSYLIQKPQVKKSTLRARYFSPAQKSCAGDELKTMLYSCNK